MLTTLIYDEIDCMISDYFVKINDMFRYNKFAPKSSKFKSHYDIPYYDPNNNLISRYTLIIYLTAGHNKNGLLTIPSENFTVYKVEQNECFIFDQKYKHEGNPYIDDDKIFIRTELICKLEKDTSDNNEDKIYSENMFNTACYMSLQSIINENKLFSKELKKYVSKCFEYATENRYYKINKETNNTYLLKKFVNEKDILYFITNGTDYYFDKKKKTKYIKNIAYITLCDYFNALREINYYLETVEMLDFNNESDISKYLDTTDNTFPSIFLGSNNKFEEIKLLHSDDMSEDDMSEDDLKEHCCDFHCSDFNPYKCPDIINYINNENKFNIKLLKEGIFILGKKLYIKSDDIIVKENLITFSDELYMKRINFAACWNGFTEGPEDYVVSDNAVQIALPNIKFDTVQKMYKLSIDMFHNNLIFRTPTNINFLTVKN